MAFQVFMKYFNVCFYSCFLGVGSMELLQDAIILGHYPNLDDEVFANSVQLY